MLLVLWQVGNCRLDWGQDFCKWVKSLKIGGFLVDNSQKRQKKRANPVNLLICLGAKDGT